MKRWMTGLTLLLLASGSLATATGCGEREHTKVRVEERQSEGDVHESKPGEMVVE